MESLFQKQIGIHAAESAEIRSRKMRRPTGAPGSETKANNGQIDSIWKENRVISLFIIKGTKLVEKKISLGKGQRANE